MNLYRFTFGEYFWSIWFILFFSSEALLRLLAAMSHGQWVSAWTLQLPRHHWFHVTVTKTKECAKEKVFVQNVTFLGKSLFLYVTPGNVLLEHWSM